MRTELHPLPLAALGLATLLSAPSCSINPATGGRQLALIGEGQEIAIGQEAHEQVTTSMGLYDDEGLQEYVQRLGAELAATSERPDLPWTFRVVDDPVVNAFALPGGYIYVTRGILAHLGSEAELAAVLGHEIGHVTARHSVNQMSKQQLFQLGLGIGMVVSPELQRFGDLAQTGLGLLFLKYSRDDERQADDLGLRYMERAGYDPTEMPGVFEMLGRVSSLEGAGRVPGWLATHPAPDARSERIARKVAGLPGDGEVDRREYLRRLDGMVFGQDPREGYFRQQRFFHPELAFQLDFPRGWEAVNQRQRVLAVSPQEDAVVMLTLAGEETAEAALRAFTEQSAVQQGRVWRRAIQGLPAVWGSFEVPGQERSLAGTVAFLTYDDRIYRLLGYGFEESWIKQQGAVEGTIGSFREVDDPEILGIEPARIEIVETGEELSLEQLMEEHETTASRQEISLVNRLDPGQILPAGSLYKNVTGGVEEE